MDRSDTMQTLTFSNPVEYTAKHEYTRYRINALIGDREIGAAHYTHKNKGRWYFAELAVHEEYQNRGIGSSLFHHCIHRIAQQNPISIEWTVVPQDSNRSLQQLAQWYRKRVESLTLPHATLTEKNFGYAVDMTLTFNQGISEQQLKTNRPKRTKKV